LNGRWGVPGVCIFLAVVICIVFGQTLHHDFVNLDDDVYVYDNVQVVHGLTLHGMAWAFTTSSTAYWHPLTWLSHMLDCQLWGLKAGGHHLTNVLLHTANALLLFLVLRRMTGALWRSALVAALFAVHPLDVESVAWVAERKNLLSTLFWLLTMGAYARYAEESKVRSPTPLVREQASKVYYGLTLVFFALGLMSKPMLVTLPFALLLLDYWPLGRFSVVSVTGSEPSTPPRPQIVRLVLEKVPLLLLAGGSSMITYLGQKNLNSVTSLQEGPLGMRLAKLPLNYVGYLRDTIWPKGLTVFYPYPATFSVATVGLSVLLLAGLTLLALWTVRSRPYLAVGWFWFLGTMIPVIGLVQVGNTPVADRFTYVPQIGLYVMAAWAARDLTVPWRCRRPWRVAMAALVMAALMACATIQTSYWRNSESLWARALACDPENFHAYNNSGNDLLQKGRVDEAIGQFHKALQINPGYAKAHNNLGNALVEKGEADEAMVQYQMVLQINPDDAKACYNLGNVLLQKGRVDEAIRHFQNALQINPDYAKAWCNLGNARLQKGQLDEAIIDYQKAVQSQPDSAEIHYDFGNALLEKGKVDEAIAHYQMALQIAPDYTDAHNNLGNALRQKGKVDEAIAHYQMALQIKPGYADAHNNLGSALRQKGRLDEAIAHYQIALQIKPGYAEAHNNLGGALLQKGRVDEAIAQFQMALQIKPDYPDAHNNLGHALLQKEQADKAPTHF